MTYQQKQVQFKARMKGELSRLTVSSSSNQSFFTEVDPTKSQKMKLYAKGDEFLRGVNTLKAIIAREYPRSAVNKDAFFEGLLDTALEAATAPTNSLNSLSRQALKRKLDDLKAVLNSDKPYICHSLWTFGCGVQCMLTTVGLMIIGTLCYNSMDGNAYTNDEYYQKVYSEVSGAAYNCSTHTHYEWDGFNASQPFYSLAGYHFAHYNSV